MTRTASGKTSGSTPAADVSASLAVAVAGSTEAPVSRVRALAGVLVIPRGAGARSGGEAVLAVLRSTPALRDKSS